MIIIIIDTTTYKDNNNNNNNNIPNKQGNLASTASTLSKLTGWIC